MRAILEKKIPNMLNLTGDNLVTIKEHMMSELGLAVERKAQDKDNSFIGIYSDTGSDGKTMRADVVIIDYREFKKLWSFIHTKVNTVNSHTNEGILAETIRQTLIEYLSDEQTKEDS